MLCTVVVWSSWRALGSSTSMNESNWILLRGQCASLSFQKVSRIAKCGRLSLWKGLCACSSYTLAFCKRFVNQPVTLRKMKGTLRQVQGVIGHWPQ